MKLLMMMKALPSLECETYRYKLLYSNIYTYFKKRYDFSKLFYMYDLPLYRHLYSAQEIDQFKNKWLTAMEGTR